jgi:hypothetical protein
MKGSRLRSMSERFLDEEQVWGCWADVDLSHAPAVTGSRVQSGRPFLDGGLLLCATAVAGVNRHHYYSARCKQFQRLLQGDAGCIRAGDDTAVPPREVAEIEQHDLHRPRDMLCQLFVTDRLERHPARQLRFGQPAAGLVNSLLLNVKTPDMAINADQTCQQQGVMPVAAGRINCDVPVTHKAVQEQV